MKKVITSILIVLIIFNFILCNHTYVFAEDQETTKAQNTYAGTDTEVTQEDILETAEGGSSATSVLAYVGTSAIGAVVGILSAFIDFCVLSIDIVLSQLTYNEGSEDLSTNEKDIYWLTIEKMVFNKVALFNINFFNTYESGYEVGEFHVAEDDNNIAIKNSISKSYYICRLLAVAISVLVLIYIGIRMAIASVASEQAKYKKMLMSWVESIVLLFLMPYLMSAMFTLGEVLVEIFYNIEQNLIGTTIVGSTTATYGVFEVTVRTSIINYILSGSGLKLAMWSIVYWVLLFTEVKFFWLYLKRVLMVGFLIIISPLITITYSIDKVGDGKAQAFTKWFSEFTLNAMIQPLHALLYVIFVLSANAIAASSPLVACALLMAMGQAERMVKVVFNMRNAVTLRGVDKFMKKEG